MKFTPIRVYRVITVTLTMMVSLALSQTSGGDLLNEAPLSTLPEAMTFEEYRDMNRRMTIGMALAAVPLPGIVHFYAGEKKRGYLLLGSAAIGVVSIIAGISSMDEGDFESTDFDVMILNGGEDSERQYEKIPIEVTGSETTYKLRELHRRGDGGGGGLVVLGGAIILVDIAYDIFHGLYTIEKKRDAVRFKYGKMISSVSLQPRIDTQRAYAGVALSLAF